MSLAIDKSVTAGDLASQDDYRALSSAAVASLVAGALSFLCFFSFYFGLIAVFGVALGVVALHRIRTTPTEFTGRKLALAGMFLSIAFWGAGSAFLVYVYFTEVPEGYQRISYSQLQPEDGASRDAVPAAARLLDGKRVFIKGFMYPGVQKTEIRDFVLCRDRGTCCFGGPTPKLTDMIQVRLKEPLSLDYSLAVRGLAGTFRVRPDQASDNLGGVLYHLEADYAK